jgi:hypothetical protein
MDFDHNLPKPDPRESQWTFTKIAILVIGLIALIVLMFIDVDKR